MTASPKHHHAASPRKNQNHSHEEPSVNTGFESHKQHIRRHSSPRILKSPQLNFTLQGTQPTYTGPLGVATQETTTSFKKISSPNVSSSSHSKSTRSSTTTPFQPNHVSIHADTQQALQVQIPMAPIQPDPGVSGETQSKSNTKVETGVKFEICLGLASTSIFLCLWILLMSNTCTKVLDLVFYIKVFSLLGGVMGIFVTILSIFETTISPHRSFSGCVLSASIVMVSGANLVGAYLAMGCVCKCTRYPIKESGEDMVIFVLEICGSACLLAVLLAATSTSARSTE